MKGPGRARRRDDAVALWSELRRELQQRFHEHARAPEGRRARPRRRLLLSLELMWRLEEQTLLPALIGVDADIRDDATALARELLQLRELAGMLREDRLDPAGASVAIAALDGMTALRALRLERALDHAVLRRHLDGAALARDMDERLARWREEVTVTGELEDEEMEPLHRPLR